MKVEGYTTTMTGALPKWAVVVSGHRKMSSFPNHFTSLSADRALQRRRLDKDRTRVYNTLTPNRRPLMNNFLAKIANLFFIYRLLLLLLRFTTSAVIDRCWC